MPKYVSARPISRGVYRKRWRAKWRKRWVGTVVVAAVTPNRRRQVWIT